MLFDYIKTSIVNLAIIISVVSIEKYLTKGKAITPKSPVWLRLLLGLVCGLAGCMLVINGCYFRDGMVLDFRDIMLIYSASTGGILSAVISSTSLLFIEWSYADSGYLFMTVIAANFIPALITGLLAEKRKSEKTKWVFGIALAIIAANIKYLCIYGVGAISFIIHNACFTIVISVLVFYYCKFLSEFGHDYRMLKVDASTDPLTGLYNVRGFEKKYTKEADFSLSCVKPLSFMFIDVDFFKKVNDSFGHCEGDRVLVQIAEIIHNSCRTDDIVGRIGGEEFAVVMPGCIPGDAYNEAQHIRSRFEATHLKLSNGHEIKVSISIGVSAYPDMTDDPYALRELADLAVNIAKHSGRNKVVLYSPFIEQPAVME